MKQIDRFLLAIIAGVVALVVIALVLAVRRTEPGYLAETTPSSVAHNYLLALKQHDDARAYSYLSNDLPGYPANLDAFVADVNRTSWGFDRETTTVSVAKEYVIDERAVITLNETRFYEDGIFNSRHYTNSFNITLHRKEGAWKLISAQSYWVDCWTIGRPCR